MVVIFLVGSPGKFVLNRDQPNCVGLEGNVSCNRREKGTCEASSAGENSSFIFTCNV